MPDIVAFAADHAGYELKDALIPVLREMGFEILDLGTNSGDSVDYPRYADALAAAMGEGRAKWGVLVCGTGIGISIAANRHRQVRAALCHDSTAARLSRQHNDANVLVLGGRLTGIEVAKDCARTFFSTDFEGGRHARRVALLSDVR
jgi:ribose 5-phosphate isomerase B